MVAAGIDLRVFDQRRYLVEQIGIAAEACVLADRRFLELPIDFGAPRGEARHDLAVALEARRILIRALQLDRPFAEKAVPGSAPPGGETEHRCRHEPRTVKCHQTVHRADELRLAGSPAHQLRNRQSLERFREQRREHLVEQRAFHLHAREHHRALGRVAPLELLGFHAMLAREALQRRGRRLGRGAGDFHLASRRLVGYTGDGESETPRRGVDRKRRFRIRQPRLRQRI